VRKAILMASMTLVAGPAAGADFFVGGEFGHWEGEITLTDESSNLSLSDEDQGENFGIRFGAIADHLRVYGTYQDPTDEESGTNAFLLTLNADYLFRAPSRPLNAFIGGKTGLYYDEVENFFADGTDLESTETLLGLEGGLLYTMDPVQLEAGARYMVGVSSDNNWEGVETELDNISEVYAAVNLVF